MKKSYLVMAAALFLLSGCSKVTKENYDKIKVGMSYDEVVALIGKPEGCDEIFGVTSCEWKSGKAEVKAKFISDQVTYTTASGLK
ncbi:DUF3862 domain-containing protein [Sulfurimonas sp. HSL3-7]|uniref:DUF3862 domain-containing protein n=1 Tax=Sulfonitrofixus jiaomeiensis TaxID=3131938 RepID=UPI0031F7C52C